MISRLVGKVVEETPGLLVIDCGGVCYDVRLPLPPRAEDHVPLSKGEGHVLEIHVIHHITQDSQSLLGFPTREHKELARLLIDKVGGIGPTLALAAAGNTDPAVFKQAVVAKDEARLARIKGVGPKTARRIIAELAEAFEKMGAAGVWEEQVSGKASAAETDAVMALVSLGYKKTEAGAAVKQAVTAHGKQADVQTLIRAALAAGRTK